MICNFIWTCLRVSFYFIIIILPCLYTHFTYTLCRFIFSSSPRVCVYCWCLRNQIDCVCIVAYKFMHMVIKILLIKLDDAWIEMPRLSVSCFVRNVSVGRKMLVWYICETCIQNYKLLLLSDTQLLSLLLYLLLCLYIALCCTLLASMVFGCHIWKIKTSVKLQQMFPIAHLWKLSGSFVCFRYFCVFCIQI